jgi:hypothetical protein
MLRFLPASDLERSEDQQSIHPKHSARASREEKLIFHKICFFKELGSDMLLLAKILLDCDKFITFLMMNLGDRLI